MFNYLFEIQGELSIVPVMNLSRAVKKNGKVKPSSNKADKENNPYIF